MKRTPIEYDAQSDTLQIYLSDAPIEESSELQPGLIVDYDAAGNIVGIELLDASEIVKQTPEPVAVGK
ncbi:MAG: DUF2283 domain-containing protein [Chloroflexi bacterium]|nr:DUF2283 domain-containing protein [Chloroflexota bacterium]MCC6892762.1 DUF2283 domain-containing protein [Anaerolineae bacterium]